MIRLVPCPYLQGIGFTEPAISLDTTYITYITVHVHQYNNVKREPRIRLQNECEINDTSISRDRHDIDLGSRPLSGVIHEPRCETSDVQAMTGCACYHAAQILPFPLLLRPTVKVSDRHERKHTDKRSGLKP